MEAALRPRDAGEPRLEAVGVGAVFHLADGDLAFPADAGLRVRVDAAGEGFFYQGAA